MRLPKKTIETEYGEYELYLRCKNNCEVCLKNCEFCYTAKEIIRKIEA